MEVREKGTGRKKQKKKKEERKESKRIKKQILCFRC